MDFFHITIKNGVLYGRIIDILNRGSEIAILALGMTLVVSASAGTDISVGSVMSLAGGTCCALIAGFGVTSVSSLADCAHPIWFGIVAGIAAAKAGLPGKVVDNTARKVIEDAGYGEYFGHGFGHSVGLEIHERPNCGRFSEEIMVENAVASAEPGIYIPGKFGVRIEDVLIYKPEGSENITHSPKNLIII